jgi:ABC-type dipeptide/oligopeptide/nickel transport system permease component
MRGNVQTRVLIIGIVFYTINLPQFVSALYKTLVLNVFLKWFPCILTMHASFGSTLVLYNNSLQDPAADIINKPYGIIFI